jgi:hypothetical protein
MSSLTVDELRAMIRESIVRHGGSDPSTQSGDAGPVRTHASHALFAVARGGDADGMCIIEPAVRCTHCGFCQSYGH